VLTLLHISDLHFGPFFVPEAAEAVVRAVPELDPDIVIVSGDFTQRAKRQQYEEARSFLERLPRRPTIVVPGNHDVPLYRVLERVFRPYALYREHISHELDTVVHHERAVIVALNSTSPLRAITNGRIRSWQLEFCERAFEAAGAGVSRIVVAHHHFAPAPDYERAQVMPKAKRALDRFKALKVDLILGGHLHRAYIGNSLDVYPGRDRDHGIIIVQSGTTTSRRGRAREREKNTLNVIRIGDQVVRVTHYMFFSELDGFAPVSRHIFPRPGREYLDDVAHREEEPVTLAPPVGVPDDVQAETRSRAGD
jgi:3',5'-cyclic AMP phosphodiesterase CpdA